MTQPSLFDNDWCHAHAQTVLDAFRGRDFCSDDVHSIIKEPENRNLIGALMGHLAKAGKIERIGSTKSTRPSRNKSWVGVYRVRQ